MRQIVTVDGCADGIQALPAEKGLTALAAARLTVAGAALGIHVLCNRYIQLARARDKRVHGPKPEQ